MDLISRQAAIKAICEDGTWLESQGCTEISMAERKQRDADILGELPSAEPKRKTGKTLAEEVERIKREITDIFAEQMGVQPSAQPERKKGKWINNSPVTMKCDQCGYVIKDWRWNELNFCANCGADMRGEQDG